MPLAAGFLAGAGLFPFAGAAGAFFNAAFLAGAFTAAFFAAAFLAGAAAFLGAGAGALEVGDLQIGILSDVYLSGVWIASLDRFARMADAMGDTALATSARAIRAKARATLESTLWLPDLKQYAFALLKDGSVNANLTGWPGTEADR